MASRRDELNAYTFAKKRMVAAFLQPSATGTEEGAPRPLRAIVPGLTVGALILAGFGAWGMFRPQAPRDWDRPGARVIVGKSSTTRYVVLTTAGRPRLHPVLNLASARLLLDPADSRKVIQVSDTILDAGKPPRGPVIGIPYAPDRLPDPEDAGRAKRWAVCQQPGAGGKGVRSAAFVFGAREAGLTDGARRLTGTQVLYVQGPDEVGHLVDAHGVRYRVGGPQRYRGTLRDALVGVGRRPQPVTADWLATLHEGAPLAFPELPGTPGADAGVPGLTAADNRVGTVLRATTGSGPQHYVVLPGEVRTVSAFTAWLLIHAPETGPLRMRGRARDVDLQSLDPRGAFAAGARWPRDKTTQVNTVPGGDFGPGPDPGLPGPGSVSGFDAGSGSGSGSASGAESGVRDTVCSVLLRSDSRGRTRLGVWAGSGFPADIAATGGSTYVTPGTGLLYTQVQGAGADGSLFLLTDTGLRYAVQANGDSDARRSGIGAATPGPGHDGRPEPGRAQIRLGYGRTAAVPVPIAWSEFLAKGPRLDTNSARRPQGS